MEFLQSLQQTEEVNRQDFLGLKPELSPHGSDKKRMQQIQRFSRKT
jgi:hypothetical protein